MCSVRSALGFAAPGAATEMLSEPRGSCSLAKPLKIIGLELVGSAGQSLVLMRAGFDPCVSLPTLNIP